MHDVDPAGQRASGMSRRRLAAQRDQGPLYSQRKAELRRAAAILFKQRGLENVSLLDIAKAAGMNRATVYYYAASKDEIFLDITLDALQTFLQNVEDLAASELKPAEKIRAFCIQIMEHYHNNYPYLYLYIQERSGASDAVTSTRKEELVRLSSRIDELVYGMIQAGKDDGSLRPDLHVRIAAFGILGMANWSHRWFDPAGPMSGAEIGGEFARMVLDGLRSD